MDRVLAAALTLYESSIDPSHGQRRDLALDPDLIDEWTAVAPVRDGAALAMAMIAATVKDDEHHDTFKFRLGLREGWEERKAARVAERQRPLDDAN